MNIYQCLATHQRTVKAIYVPSSDNISDPLSRGEIPLFLAGFPIARHRTDLPLPIHLLGKLTSW